MNDNPSPGDSRFASDSVGRSPAAASSHLGTLSGALRIVVYLGLAATLGATAATAVKLSEDRARFVAGEDRLVALQGLVAPTQKRLAPEYSDTQGRLLADPPSDAAKLLDPDELMLAYDVDAESEASPVDWAGLQAQLARVTGKPVVLEEYSNTAHDVSAVRDGNIHIAALHSADAPYLVNTAGFIPFGVLGTEAGASGNRLDIAVPATSKIRTLADVDGQKLTCTRPDSITGYRAAVALLLQETGMRPFVDYSINWSLGQSESIRGLAGGKIKIAAISDDKLQAMLKKGSVQESDFRVIYQSPVIPRLTIGHVYNLRPELAAKLSSAIFDFDNAQGTADESSGKQLRFFPADYKRDYELVRKIDEAFDPRVVQRVRANRTRSTTDTGADK